MWLINEAEDARTLVVTAGATNAARAISAGALPPAGQGTLTMMLAMFFSRNIELKAPTFLATTCCIS
jgi:hypothetical protein